MKRNNEPEGVGPSRRELLAMTGALAGAALAGCRPLRPEVVPPAPAPPAAAANGSRKPVYVPEIGIDDPVAHSVAENLFWNDVLMEHAAFFVMFLPGPELAPQRAQAEGFRAIFAARFAETQSVLLDRQSYPAFDRRTAELVKPFIDFKFGLRDAQAAGKIHTLAWPAFYDHTGREAERYLRRLLALADGHTEFDRTEVVDFWGPIMAEHAEFIAHFLSPEEGLLIEKALRTGDRFRDLAERRPTSDPGRDPVLAAAEEMVNFSTQTERGIRNGRVQSMMLPALADHLRREALKCVDEIKRTQSRRRVE